MNNFAVSDLLDGFVDPAVLLGTNYRILATNKAYRRRFQCEEDPIGSTCYEISHHYDRPCDQMGEECPLRECRVKGIPKRLLHLHHTPYGRIHEQVATFPVRNVAGELTYFIEVLTQVRLAKVNPGEVGLVGTSTLFNQVLTLIARVAPAMTPVLLLGESGTGKELAAQAIHRASARADGPFVPVECSGLSEVLFESELFGHEKGAFAGAFGRRTGLVEAANGGTLFLNELGDIPTTLQVKLLRLLETGTYRRMGSIEPQRADFRLICATHRDLKTQITTGTFRQDLFYRLSTFPIRLPALRERMGDLPLLVRALLDKIESKRKLELAPTSLDLLRSYGFPGNVRELRSILERAALLADSQLLLPEHLPEEVQVSALSLPKEINGLPLVQGVLPLEEVERRYLKWAAGVFNGNRRELAQVLGLSERTLYRRLELEN